MSPRKISELKPFVVNDESIFKAFTCDSTMRYTEHDVVSASRYIELQTQWREKFATNMDMWAAQSVEWQGERALMGRAIDRLSVALQRAARWAQLGIGDYVSAWAKIQVCEDWQLMDDALKEVPLTWQDTPQNPRGIGGG